jgi:Animal haem peroxidase
MNLLVLRNQLRKYNLYDTRAFEVVPTPRPVPRVVPAEFRSIRTPDGSFNDLSDPDMGKTGMPFGRMWPLGYKWPGEDKLMTPNPRLVSERLLARDHFRPATSLNLLAAAWIQFQVHGWIDHRRFDHAKFQPNNPERTHQVPAPPEAPWPGGTLHVPKTIVDESAIPKGRAYANELSPWWSLSQVYGRSDQMSSDLRSMQDGKIKVDPATGRLLEDADVKGIDHTGFNNNYWVGLSLLHTIFSLEHNAICDMLKATYPNWNDEQLFQKARLINAALNAKIHTVEWTPAILFHPTIKLGLEGNWWGAIRNGKFAEFAAGLVDVEAKKGIPGSTPDHHNATYSLPEEFVTVYKMHPLIPDEIELFQHGDGTRLGQVPFREANGKHTRAVIDKYGPLDVWYSFGVTHPGAITLQNFPNSLREFETIEGIKFDLATHDIIRERERGIPRYNDFRELLHRPRLNSIDELTPDPEWRKRLNEVYGDDINNVDTMVGLYAEPLPPGFGFSDTAFRVFILTASRRLKSDRYFTVDYTPQVYTAEGLDWIEKNDMRTMILRHHPELAPALTRTKNTFHPWMQSNR